MALLILSVGLIRHHGNKTNDTTLIGIAVPANDLIGVPPQTRRNLLDEIVQSGSSSVRVDFYLTTLVTAPGAYDWSGVDALVADCRSRNLSIDGLIQTLPAFARPAGSAATWGPVTAAQRRVVVDFAAAASGRYADSVDTWEIWNEPNLSAFWSPTPDPVAYAQLLREVYPAIKKASPRATVITGGTGGKTAPRDIEATQFLSRMYAANITGVHDGVAVHAYTDPAHGSLGEVSRLQVYRRLMDSLGDSREELWLTECGTQVGSGAGEKAQAEDISRILAAWRQVRAHGRIYFFTLTDNQAPGFGLLRSDGSRRPAYAALQQATRAHS